MSDSISLVVGKKSLTISFSLTYDAGQSSSYIADKEKILSQVGQACDLLAGAKNV